MSATNNQKILRLLYTSQKTALCSAIELLDGPEKTQFAALVPDYDKALAGLPVEDDAKPADDNLVNSVTASNSLITSLLSAVGSLKQKLALAGAATPAQIEAALNARVAAGELILKAALPAQVESAITIKTAAGELIPKALHTQICAEAKTNGLTEGEKKVRDEIAAAQVVAVKVATRKTLRASASLPLPELDAALAPANRGLLGAPPGRPSRRSVMNAWVTSDWR